MVRNLPIRTILVLVACLAVSTEPAFSQPPGRGGGGGRGGPDRGREDRGREDRGRADRGQGDRGRGDRGRGDRGRGDRGEQRGSSDDRRAAYIRSWDGDGDGYVSVEEVPRRMQGYYKRLAERAGVSATGRVKIEDIVSKSGRGERGRSSNDPLAFGEESNDAKAPGFDGSGDSDGSLSGFVPASPEERDGARESADGLMKKYDQNGNGILERDEWSRISGTPANADANRDGRISRTELINRIIMMRRARRTEGRSSSVAKKDSKERSGGSDSKRDDSHRSYRFSTPLDRIPEEALSWITSRDKNGDGQVAMYEYSSTWTDSRVREFSRYDGNLDGVITPEEYLAGK